MIYFDINSRQDIINEHYDSLKTHLDSKIASSSINKELKDYIEINIEKIIKGNPNELKLLNTNFKSLNNYSSSIIIRNKIFKIFDYKSLLSDKTHSSLNFSIFYKYSRGFSLISLYLTVLLRIRCAKKYFF